MRIALAYLSLILLWSTTPLAIKWSGMETGFIFAVTARMSIGLVGILCVLALLRQRLPWHRQARLTYLAVFMQTYASMLVVYWAALTIPSGWISVLFGLTPFFTAILSAVWLGESSLSISKVLAYILGVTGLGFMFHSALSFGADAVNAIIATLIGVVLQAFSAVWIKRIDAKIPATTQVAGGLSLTVPMFLLTWYCLDGQIPATISVLGLSSILYLGIVATVIGFALYFYILTYLSAASVALITLITPVLALLLGHQVNQEPLTLNTAVGTSMIIIALLLHSFGDSAIELD